MRCGCSMLDETQKKQHEILSLDQDLNERNHRLVNLSRNVDYNFSYCGFKLRNNILFEC